MPNRARRLTRDSVAALGSGQSLMFETIGKLVTTLRKDQIHSEEVLSRSCSRIVAAQEAITCLEIQVFPASLVLGVYSRAEYGYEI